MQSSIEQLAFREIDGPTPEEYVEAQKHRAEINRQFAALVFNCPWHLPKFLLQRRKILADIDRNLIEGFYLHN